MRDIIVAIIVFGLLPKVFVKPHIGILLWSWIGYMNPHRLAWGFARFFPFSYIVAVVTLLALLISKEKKSFPLTPITSVLVFFNIWMLITTIFSIFPEEAWPQYLKVSKIQLMTFITLMLMTSFDRINALIWVIVGSIGFYGIKGGIYTILTEGSGMVWGPPGGYIEGNNELALALLMVLPLTYYLRSISENIWIRQGLLLSMGLMLIASIGSQSRGALLAAAAVLLFFWVKSKNKLLSGLSVVLVSLSIILFMPTKWHERMQSIMEYEKDTSAMGRINAWGTAYNVAKDRFFGGGYNFWSEESFLLYAPNPEDVHDAHSIYFEILGEHGFIGLLIYLLLGLLAFRTGRWIIRNSSDNPDNNSFNTLAKMIQVSLIAYYVGGAFLGLAYFDLYYHLVAILVLARKILEQNLEVLETASATIPNKRLKFSHAKR